MKFGKELLRASAASSHVVSPEEWIDYKRLKKMLKKMFVTNTNNNSGKKSSDSDDADDTSLTSTPPFTSTSLNPTGATTTTTTAAQLNNTLQSTIPATTTTTTSTTNPTPLTTTKEKLVHSEAERIFFREINKELDKVSQCFSKLLIVAMKQEEHCLANHRGESWNRMSSEQIRLFTETHMLLLLIENFAVLNYCGFTKILKKHDKLTATTTKELFVSRKVNATQFANLHTLREALERLEKTFQTSRNMVSPFRESPSAAERDLEQRHDEISQINKTSHDRLKSLADVALAATTTTSVTAAAVTTTTGSGDNTSPHSISSSSHLYSGHHDNNSMKRHYNNTTTTNNNNNNNMVTPTSIERKRLRTIKEGESIV
jgi:hypothetical protein